MTTVDDAIDQALDHLDGINRPQVNRLNGNIDEDTETIVLEFPVRGVGANALLGVGNEYVLVLAENGQTLTVMRGYRSEATDHDSGTLVEIRPRFGRPAALRQMRSEIASWPSDLFRTDTITGTTTSGRRGYDLDLTDVTRVLQLQVGPDTSDADTMLWDRVPRGQWYVDRQADDSFPSGSALFMPDLGRSRSWRLTVAKPFLLPDTWTGVVDLEAECYLPFSLIDAAAMGTAARMVQEAPRTQQTVGDLAAAEAVPAGLLTQVRVDLRRQADQRIEQERQRLLRLWPYQG